MNETMVYADSFFEEFVGESDFLDFLKKREENTTWKKEASNSLRFEALEKNSAKTDAIIDAYNDAGKGDVQLAATAVTASALPQISLQNPRLPLQSRAAVM